MTTRNPYWLIREPGRSTGCGAVTFDEAITSEMALEVFRADSRTLLPDGYPLEAVLVTLRYENGQPVVEEVA